jgi:hypothetical protein
MATILYRKTSNSKTVQAAYTWTHTNDLTKNNKLNPNVINETTVSGKCIKDEDYVTTYSYNIVYEGDTKKQISYVYCDYVQ